ncbi:hypothetical protein [Paenibacillus humicus]|uniref:hypothetical protein n=1 Tax=Paenibacillus humicus TaxID=412861 RepID=UPI003D27891D
MFEVKESSRYARDIYAKHKNYEVIRLKHDGAGASFETEISVSEAKDLAEKLLELVEIFEPSEED